MKLFKAITIALLLGMSFLSAAWNPSGVRTTIIQIWHWENGERIVFKTASNHYCFVNDSEEKLYSAVLSSFHAGLEIELHCHNASVNIGGRGARKVHRLIIFK